MKRIVFVADVQLHNHSQNATVTADGLNSRLHYGLETLRQAASLAEGGIVVINGDLFDHRRYLEIDVLVHTYRTLVEMTKSLERIVIVVGNHDQFLKDGSVHSTEIFQSHPKIEVIGEWRIIGLGSEYGSISLCCHAFSLDIERVKHFISGVASAVGGILVLHQEVVGASMGHSICDKGLRMEDLCADRFKFVLLGHFHAPQTLAPTVHYIGSPYQVDRSEAGDQKRFLVWDGTRMAQKAVTGVPRYLSFNSVEAYEAAKTAGKVADIDFIDLTVNEGEYDAARKLADTSPTMKAVYVPEEKSDGPILDLAEFSPEAAAVAWLERNGLDSLKNEAVARLLA